MSTQKCTFEHQVVAAVKTREWTSELRDHASGCSLCSDTIVVTSALHQISVKASRETKTTAYYILWFRSQCMRKQGRLSSVDRYMLVGILAVTSVFLIGAILWKWQVVQTWVTNASVEPLSNLPVYIVAGCAALVWFLTEEVLHG